MALFEKREDFDPEVSVGVGATRGLPLEHNRNAGQHLQGSDTEEYHDGLDDWDGERENHQKEGPHFTPWERDQIEKGPEPDPDDGIHIDENEYEGWDPSTQDWAPIHTRAPLPPEWDKPMGLGAPGSASDTGRTPDFKTDDGGNTDEAPTNFGGNFGSRAAFDNDEPPVKTFERIPESDMDMGETDEIPANDPRAIYGDDWVDPTSLKGITKSAVGAAGWAYRHLTQSGETSTLDQLGTAANYIGRLDLVVGATRAVENTYRLAIGDDYWKPAPEGWKIEDQYTPAELKDVPPGLAKVLTGAENPAQLKEARERIAIHKHFEEKLKKMNPALRYTAYTGKFAGDAFASAPIGGGASTVMRATGIFRAIDQTERLAATVAAATHSQRAFVRGLGAVRGVQRGAVGGAAEAAFLYSTGVIDQTEVLTMLAVTPAAGGAVGWISPEDMLRYTKYGNQTAPMLHGYLARKFSPETAAAYKEQARLNAQRAMRHVMAEYKAHGAREVRLTRIQGGDVSGVTQDSVRVDAGAFVEEDVPQRVRVQAGSQRVDAEGNPIGPSRRGEPTEAPNAPQRGSDEAPEGPEGDDLAGTAPMRDSREEGLLNDLADDYDDGPLPTRQIVIDEDTVKYPRESGLDYESHKFAKVDNDTLHRGMRNTDLDDMTDAARSKLAEDTGIAFNRQGVGTKERRKLWVADHPANHKFAKESGAGVRHAFVSEAEALKWSSPGAKVYQVDVPKGSKHIPSEILEDWEAGEAVLLGAGKMHKRADGTYEWRPRNRVDGPNKIIRATDPAGNRIADDLLAEHNDGISKGVLSSDIEHPANKSASSAGAMQVVPQDPRRTSNFRTSMMVDDNLANPDGGLQRLTGWRSWATWMFGDSWDKNVGVTLAGEIQGGKSNIAKNSAPDLTGNTLIQNREDLALGHWNGFSGADLKMALNRRSEMKLVDTESEGFVMYLKELWQGGENLQALNMVAARLKYNEMIHHYLVNQYWRNGVIPKHLDVPSVKLYVEQYNKLKKETISYMNAPHLANGASEVYEPVGRGMHRVHQDGAVPIRLHNGAIDDFENPKDAFGNVKKDLQVEGAVKENFQSQIQRNANQAAGGRVLRRNDANDLAEIMSDMQLRKPATDWIDMTRGARTINEFVSRLRSIGIDHGAVNEFRKEARRLIAQTGMKETDFVEKVFRFDPLIEVNVPLKNGAGSRPFKLLDVSVTNSLVSHRAEVRKYNAQIAGATIPRRNSDGVPATKQIQAVDPKTGELLFNADGTKKMKTVRWTLNNSREVDAYLKDVEAELRAKGIDPETDAQFLATKELVNSLFENSAEVPWQISEQFQNFATGIKLAMSAPAAAGDMIMTARHGARALAEMPEMLDFASFTASQWDYFFKGRKSTFRGDVLMEALQEEAGAASAQNRIFGGTPFKWENEQYAFEMSGAMHVLDTMGKRASQKIAEVGLLWGGIIKVQDQAQAIAIKGEFHNLVDDAFKYGSVANMKSQSDGRVFHEWLRKGFAEKDLEEVFKMLQDPSVIKYRKTFAGGRYFAGVDRDAASFNPKTLRKMSIVLQNSIARETVLEGTPGSRIRGLDKGGWPAALQFLGFPMASGTQILRNSLKRGAEGFHDFTVGNGSRGAATLGILSGMFVAQGLGSVMLEIGKQEYKMIGRPDAEKKKFRDAYMKDPTWWVNTFIDKGPMTAIVPLLYDNLWAPFHGTPSFAGFDNWNQKRRGWEGIAENLVFHNPASEMVKTMSELPHNARKIYEGEGSVRDYNQFNPMGSLSVWGKVMELGLMQLGVAPDDPRKMKELGRKNPIEETRKAWAGSKYIKKSIGEKNQKKLFGDK